MSAHHVEIAESSEELERLIADATDAVTIRRLSCLRLYRLMVLDQIPDPVAEAAQAARVKASTLKKWLAVYAEEGLWGVLTLGRKSADAVGLEDVRARRPAKPDRPAESLGRAVSGRIGQEVRAVDLDRILSSVSDTSDALRAWRGRRQPRTMDDRTEPPYQARPVPEPDGRTPERPPSHGSRESEPDPSDDAPKKAETGISRRLAPDLDHALNPAASVGDDSSRQEPKGPSGPTSPLDGARVLLADTDDMIRSIIRHRLERRGATVVEVADGMEAVGILQSKTFDAAIVSASLPGLDGFELADWLRGSDAYGSMPLVMMEWPGDPTAMSRSFDAGADDFIRKPFSPAELVARLGRLLGRARRPSGTGGAS